ncbi:hypothetical protein FDECE_10200 [Fusarium decemcellulare]|nr:hypothetical protein FDECE_10200 [Fusarium decemcellulare]
MQVPIGTPELVTEWMADCCCSGSGGAASDFQWLLGRILRLQDDRRWLLAHSGRGPVLKSSHDVQGLPSPWHWAAVLPPLSTSVAPKTPAPKFRSLGPTTHRASQGSPVEEADASLADNVLFVRPGLPLGLGLLPPARSAYDANAMRQHLREIDVINPASPPLGSKPQHLRSTTVPGSSGARTDPHWGTLEQTLENLANSAGGGAEASECLSTSQPAALVHRRAPMDGSWHSKPKAKRAAS